MFTLQDSRNQGFVDMWDLTKEALKRQAGMFELELKDRYCESLFH